VRSLRQDDVQPQVVERRISFSAISAKEQAVVTDDEEAQAGLDEGRVVFDDVSVLVPALGSGETDVEPGGSVGAAIHQREGAAHDGGRGVEEFD
jgi:hypothetical protein